MSQDKTTNSKDPWGGYFMAFVFGALVTFFTVKDKVAKQPPVVTPVIRPAVNEFEMAKSAYEKQFHQAFLRQIGKVLPECSPDDRARIAWAITTALDEVDREFKTEQAAAPGSIR